jgi:hypothetical protein
MNKVIERAKVALPYKPSDLILPIHYPAGRDDGHPDRRVARSVDLYCLRTMNSSNRTSITPFR